MKRRNLEALAVEELVAQFEALALAQDTALLMDEIAKFNRLFDQMDAVKGELQSRQGDQRHALLVLYAHPNAQVRLKAAVATLAVAPGAARRELEKIAASKEFPQAGDAGMTLSGLDDGTFKPT